VNKCTSCRSSIQWFSTWVNVNIAGCELAPVEILGPDFPMVKPIIGGQYYQARKASKTSIGFTFVGAYGDLPIPANAGINITATHPLPINLRYPFKFTSCKANATSFVFTSLTSYTSASRECVCTPCSVVPNDPATSGISVNCAAVKFFDYLGSDADINYPDTSAICIGVPKAN
jgi:hypothetical protein